MKWLAILPLIAISACASSEPKTKQELIARMLANPYTRDMGMQMWYKEMGLIPPGYPGNCPTNYHYDAAGNRCGYRSAMARPGGY